MTSSCKSNHLPHHLYKVAWNNGVRLIALCILLAFILEACTLIGAKTASPFTLSDWSPVRMLIFFFFSLSISFYFLLHFDVLPNRSFWTVRHLLDSLTILVRMLVKMTPGLFAGTIAAVGYAVSANYLRFAWDYRVSAILFFIPFALLLLVQFRHLVSRRIEYGFLIITLSFGTLACICMPTLAEVSYDGQIHFRNAVAVSYLKGAEYTGADQIMLDPFAVQNMGLISDGELAGAWNPRMDLESTLTTNNLLLAAENDLSSFVQMQGTQTFETSTWVSIRAIGYIPNATGLWIGRLLHLNCLGQYFLAREVSIVFYAVTFFFSIRQLKSGKAILTVLGLMPSAVLMAANFSYDPWCYALVTFSIAKYVGSLQRGRDCLSVRTALSIYITFTLGVLVKAVLFPIALIFFLCPKDMFSSKRNCWYFRFGAVATVLVIAASFVLPYFISFSDTASSSVSSDARGGDDVNSARQLLFIAAHPTAFLKTLLSFLCTFFSIDRFFDATSIFAYAPYLVLQEVRYLPACLLELLVLVFATLLDRCGYNSSKLQLSISSIVGSAAAFFLVILSLYLSFTPVGSDYIGGVQNRYLLPLLAPILLLSLPKPSTLTVEKSMIYFVIVSAEYLIWVLAIAVVFLFAF